jgi:hypothetical protein
MGGMKRVNKSGNICRVEFFVEGTAREKNPRWESPYLACSRKGRMPVSRGQGASGKRS